MDPAAKPSAPEAVMLTSGASGRVNALLSLRALRRLLLLLYAVLLFILFPFRWRPGLPPCPGPAARDDRREGSRKSGPGAVVLRVPAAMVPRRQREQEAAARRAAAVWRVVAAREEGRRGRDFSLFVTARGETLFTQSWAPDTVKTKGVLVLMHGLNEHRYDHFARKLNDNGFKVYAMDWIESIFGGGVGREFRLAMLFLRTFNRCSYCTEVLDPKVGACVDGVVLTSPAIRVQPSHPLISVLAPVFSLIIPRYQFTAAYNNGPPVSRDPEALRLKYSDPLVFTGSIRIRTGYEILRLSTYLQQNLNRVNIPFLVLHGTTDTVTDPEGSRRLYEEASSTDKSIKLYKGLLHDLLIEPERDEVMEDIIGWLSSRL
ncbi:Lysophospholipase [Cocos nucifera]|uniref:Lysophospholipase n=1 Tax=Cocos nucifera TaxID=13894 RepID=A0A8K0IA26_COCNU|nr:Lysophospholipase [Cocos nucifera]